MERSTRPAVFMDRDGTLNVERRYVHTFDDWTWIDGAPVAIATFRKMGYAVVIITNQAGIARGIFTRQDVIDLHGRVQESLFEWGTQVDAFYFCPHHPDFGPPCVCRKPQPGLIDLAARELELDLASSILIGDKATDILAGTRRGLRTFLVETGYGASERHLIDATQTTVVPDVLHAARLIAQAGC